MCVVPEPQRDTETALRVPGGVLLWTQVPRGGLGEPRQDLYSSETQLEQAEANN